MTLRKKEHKLYTQIDIKELSKVGIRLNKIMMRQMTDSLARNK